MNKKEHKTHKFKYKSEINYKDAESEDEIKWWQELDEQQKWDSYHFLKKALKSYIDTQNEIVDHLLGKDWYCYTSDSTCFGVNPEIVSAIKFKYRDVNVSLKDGLKQALSYIVSNHKN